MNSIVFGGINSSTYGIYISGEGVWNAPERDAETIQIPGRNGEYVLDKGSFKNIEVTYPAFNQETSYNDFRTKVDNFRNAISSLKGYQRLTDSFHPDEYRMAAFIGGLEVKPVLYNDKSMEMNIVFNCKPQRFLTSGETQQTVTSGATITNPTLFESRPLLLVDGYGDIDVNGEPITIQQGAVMGKTLVATTDTRSKNETSVGADYSLNRATNLTTISLTGDLITTGIETVDVIFTPPVGYIVEDITDVNITDGTTASLYDMGWDPNSYRVACWIYGDTFTRGTSKTITDTATASFTTITTAGLVSNEVWNFDLTINYNGSDTFTYTLSVKKGTGTSPILWADYKEGGFRWGSSNNDIYVQSTKSALGQLYIDLDIGECYRIENGQYISINTATIFPADLPTLKPGSNTITYDNTFTSFKVTPRYWRV